MYLARSSYCTSLRRALETSLCHNCKQLVSVLARYSTRVVAPLLSAFPLRPICAPVPGHPADAKRFGHAVATTAGKGHTWHPRDVAAPGREGWEVYPLPRVVDPPCPSTEVPPHTPPTPLVHVASVGACRGKEPSAAAAGFPAQRGGRGRASASRRHRRPCGWTRRRCTRAGVAAIAARGEVGGVGVAAPPPPAPLGMAGPPPGVPGRGRGGGVPPLSPPSARVAPLLPSPAQARWPRSHARAPATAAAASGPTPSSTSWLPPRRRAQPPGRLPARRHPPTTLIAWTTSPATGELARVDGVLKKTYVGTP